jgi:hypothetical protein
MIPKAFTLKKGVGSFAIMKLYSSRAVMVGG